MGSLPIALDANPGTRTLIEFYNAGKFPRGLGLNATSREIEALANEFTEAHIFIFVYIYDVHLFMFVCMCACIYIHIFAQAFSSIGHLFDEVAEL